MRLHRLELTAFQAFAGTEVVDFDALGEGGLFLFHGPTGAGKTTLLDAIAFAFFGRVPGARAEGTRLRSDHAAATALTEVVLEATLRGERFRIRRIPEQERPKVRGDGFTTEPHRVSVDVREPDGSWRNVAARHDEAAAEVQRLLGLDHAQFCQIVLLPQGGFAQFLHANSAKRGEILQELFDVGRFVAVEDWLARRKREAEQAAAEALTAVRDTVSQAERVVPDSTHPDEWEVDPDGLTGWLEGLVEVAEATAVAAEEVAAVATAAREGADVALNSGRELAARQDEAREARAAVGAREATRPQRDDAARELAAAQQAAPVAPLLEVLDDREAVLAKLPVADGDPRELRAQADALRTRAGEAGALVELEERVAGEGSAIQRLEAGAAQHRVRVEELTAWLADAGERRAALHEAVAATTRAGDRVPGLAALAESARRRVDAATQRDALEDRLTRARAACATAREDHVASRETLADLTERRLAGIASHLARQLVDDAPCTVCGSLEHPAPAPEPAAGVPDETALRAAQERADALGIAREQAEAVVAGIEAELAAARALAGDDEQAVLITASGAAEQALRAAEEEAAQAELRAAALAEHDAAAAARGEALRAAETACAEATAEAGARRSALASDRAEIDRARGEHPTIAAHVEALVKAADLSDRLAAAVEHRRTVTADRDGVREQAIVEMMRAGFSDLADVRTARREPSVVDELAARVRMWDDALVRLRHAAEQPGLVAALEEPVPPISDLETASMRAITAERSTANALGVARDRRAELDVLREHLAERLAAARPLQERLALVRGLADLVDGRGANTQSMRLSAYVLAARLEEVASAATLRLQRMTAGRYALEHSIEGATKRGLAGLELRVVDAWTGKPRAAKSLSGGETFMASLALALGLADVVTAEAGGARLDTLFVDEGFGTLDDEGTLDQVLDVLDGLREGGRSVGIVSHVAELRQRVPVQLRVERGRDGSTLATA